MFVQAPPVILVLVVGVMKKCESKHTTAVRVVGLTTEPWPSTLSHGDLPYWESLEA